MFKNGDKAIIIEDRPSGAELFKGQEVIVRRAYNQDHLGVSLLAEQSEVLPWYVSADQLKAVSSVPLTRGTRLEILHDNPCCAPLKSGDQVIFKDEDRGVYHVTPIGSNIQWSIVISDFKVLPNKRSTWRVGDRGVATKYLQADLSDKRSVYLDSGELITVIKTDKAGIRKVKDEYGYTRIINPEERQYISRLGRKK